MNIWEADKLILFIAFVIPGFITIKAFELFFPTQRKDSSKLLIDALAYSCVNYALLSWAIYLVAIMQLSKSSPILYSLFWLLVLFVAPIIWAWLWKRFRESSVFQDSMPHPTGKPWDYFFSKREACWVVATLKSGRQIAGLYGDKSFASSSPESEELYLEKCWVMNEDGGLERPRRQTKGVMILASQIESLEFFELTGDENG
jgi:hypothetical protein